MNFPQEHIDRFKVLVKKHYGVVLSDDAAMAEAQKLVRIAQWVYEDLSNDI